jgi:hypothetical protein
VNPEHLFLGTDQDNSKDRVRKNRQAKGERITRSKLTTSDVLNIRMLDIPQKAICGLYGIVSSQVSKIKSGKQWSHL